MGVLVLVVSVGGKVLVVVIDVGAVGAGDSGVEGDPSCICLCGFAFRCSRSSRLFAARLGTGLR